MDIAGFIAARQNLIELFKAKQQLLEAAQSRFPKSHPIFKAILKLCHNDATCRIRFLCDVAICACADRYGDDLFRNRVPGVPAVTHFFYGISHLLPKASVVLTRTKEFTASDIELFEEVYRLGRKFIDSASIIPFLRNKEFIRETTRFEKAFEMARAQVEKSCALYTAYLHLQEKVPKSIASDIVALSEAPPGTLA